MCVNIIISLFSKYLSSVNNKVYVSNIELDVDSNALSAGYVPAISFIKILRHVRDNQNINVHYVLQQIAQVLYFLHGSAWRARLVEHIQHSDLMFNASYKYIYCEVDYAIYGYMRRIYDIKWVDALLLSDTELSTISEYLFYI